MRTLLTLIAGLLAPSLFAANLSFLAPTNDVLPTNLGRFRASNIVAAVNVGIRTNDPSESLEGLGGFKFRSPATASSAFYDHTNSRFHILTHSSKTGYIEVAELDNAFVRNRMGIDSIGPSTPHPLHLWANGASRWVVGTDGSLYPENHNASIIGQSVSPLSLVATGLFANLGMPALPVTNIYSETNIINKRVGIGTTAPAAALHVVGAIITEGSGTNEFGPTALTNLSAGYVYAGTGGFLISTSNPAGDTSIFITNNDTRAINFPNSLKSQSITLTNGLTYVSYDAAWVGDTAAYRHYMTNAHNGVPASDRWEFVMRVANVSRVPFYLTGDGKAWVNDTITVSSNMVVGNPSPGGSPTAARGVLDLRGTNGADIVLANTTSPAQFTNRIITRVDGSVTSNNTVNVWVNDKTGTNGTNVVRFRADNIVESPGIVWGNNGLASMAADAAVAGAASGWTNTFGKNAWAGIDGTGVTYVWYNGAGTAVYTNLSGVANAIVPLQPNGKVLITAGTGVSITGVPW